MIGLPDLRKARELLNTVVALPESDRRAFLETNCPDASQREAIERQLATGSTDPSGLPAELLPFAPTLLNGDSEPSEPANSERFPTIAGYEILERLGQGGMGQVFKARQLAQGRTVALKMIQPGMRGREDAESARRFRIEAEAVSRIQHPGIVRIYGVGEHQSAPFLELEYVDGGNLADQLNGQAWPAADAARLVEELAAAIQAAHDCGIVHRDLKPSNVLLQKETLQPKVADFGLAKLLNSDAQPTISGRILGTPCYMAPEQAYGRNKLVGPATDVYGLGAILYQLLTGRPPFVGESPLEVMDQVRDSEPVPPRRLCADVPRDLETICLKCLAKESGQRYASAAALQADLHQFRQGALVRARPVSLASRIWRRCRRRPLVSGLTAAVVLMAAILTAVAFRPAADPALPPPSDPNTLKLGIWPWVGYAPLVVAAKMDLCEGLHVELVDCPDGIADARQHLKRHAIDGTMCIVDSHVHTRADDIKARVVLKLDVSNGADGIVADQPFSSLAELKGKKFAYVHEEAPHFLLLNLCKREGLTLQSLGRIEPASADRVAELFIQDQVNVAVTWQPYLNHAVEKGKGYCGLSSANVKGKIVDILCIDENYLHARRENVQKLIRGWFKAVELLQRGTPDQQRETRAIVKEFFDPEGAFEWDYDKMLPGMEYADVADNIQFFLPNEQGSNEFQDLMSEAQDVWLENYNLREKIVPRDADGSDIFMQMSAELLEISGR